MVALAASVKGAHHEFHLTYKQILSLFTADDLKESHNLNRYIKATSNYLQSCHRLHLYEELEESLQSLKKLWTTQLSADLQAEILENQILYEALLYMNTQQWDRAGTIPDMVTSLLKDFGNKINEPRKMILIFNSMIIHFFLEEWDKMREWLNALLAFRNSGFRKDLISTGLILEMIYFVQREESHLVPYLKRAAQRKVTHLSQKSILNLVKQLVDLPLPEREGVFKKLANLLADLVLKTKEGENIAGYSEMYYWAMSRKEKIPLVVAMKNFPLV
jgi:hypothetical protein